MFVHVTYDTQKPLKSNMSGFGLLCIHTQMRGLSDSSISKINVRSLVPNSRWEGNADVCRVYSIKLYNKPWHPKDKLTGLWICERVELHHAVSFEVLDKNCREAGCGGACLYSRILGSQRQEKLSETVFQNNKKKNRKNQGL